MNLRKFKNKVLVGAGSTLAVFGLGTLSVFSPQISANGVNDYIFSKNYQKKTTVNNIQWWLNHRDDANMSYRYGKPEGVLVHETANSGDKLDSNAIWNEINYMLNHSDSAFVHSFVDSNQAIEIADSGYLSWGAGAMGNARFIQTEQVQVEGKDAFAEELFNLAVLQASYLKKYNLSPSLGGTVWSHSMVSHQLGGTNHSDPDGYWADMAARFFGTTYTMNDYEYLLEQIYNQANVKAKYKVGDKVQIASYATNEANGYDLRPRQNWVGTVKSVTANNQGNSHFEYYVEYGNADENNMHVLEQDLQAAP
ncbi:N-acetylmuramoyl-L-alanine amidase, partial [Weissella confusa]|uniref:N-acetylmuramoyl-L-alanine amidase n=2 Tax=Weissella confusa TaxID=1583 RepID=UPI001C0F7491